MPERREHFRVPVNLPGQLRFRASPEVYGCMVLDKSGGGVQVELGDSVDIPEEVTIQFSDGASQLVRRCWSSGSRAGFQFIEAVAALSEPPGAAPPAGAGAAAAGCDHVRITAATLAQRGEDGDMQCSAELVQAFFQAQPRAGMASGAGSGSGAQLVRRLGSEHAAAREVVAAALLLHFFGAKWQKFVSY